MLDASEHRERRGERLRGLTRTDAASASGQLLRRFWQPIAVSANLPPGKAQPVRVLAEDLTLFRSAEGRAHLVGGSCAHRGTKLHTGWVEGDEIRCMYHGWRYNELGKCTHRPAERDESACSVSISGYPVHEYAGLVFAYLGPGEPPPFDLPRKAAWEVPDTIILARKQVWDVNWLQMVENSLDAVHVSFVHAYGRGGNFIEAVTQAIPELEYLETTAGIRQIATRGQGNVRVSDWTFPNNNHISVPGLENGGPWMDIGVWMVPVDDEHTARVNLYAAPAYTPEADTRVRAYFADCTTYNASDHHDDLFYNGCLPDDTLLELTNAQDYIAQRGQGVIADRESETLGRSDAGIALLRRILLRECDLIAKGGEAKVWTRLSTDADLPKQRASA